MYKSIKALPTTRAIYAEKLVAEGVLTAAEADKLVESYRQSLDDGVNVAPGVIEGLAEAPELQVDWSKYVAKDWRVPYEGKVPLDRIQALATQLGTLPDGLVLHSRVKRAHRQSQFSRYRFSPLGRGGTRI